MNSYLKIVFLSEINADGTIQCHVMMFRAIFDNSTGNTNPCGISVPGSH